MDTFDSTYRYGLVLMLRTMVGMDQVRRDTYGMAYYHLMNAQANTFVFITCHFLSFVACFRISVFSPRYLASFLLMVKRAD